VKLQKKICPKRYEKINFFNLRINRNYLAIKP